MASMDIRRLGLGAMALIGASLVFKGVKGKEISKKEEDNLALEIGIDSVMGAETFNAEEWWEKYRDELEAVDKSSLDEFELMIWNDDIVRRFGKAKMMQLIINTMEYSYKLSPQLARVAFQQEKDEGEYEEDTTFEEVYDPESIIFTGGIIKNAEGFEAEA